MSDKNKPQSKEQEIHIAICQYIRNKYPDVLFSSESGGIRVSMGLAKKLKLMRSCDKLPDLMIFEPRKQYKGLFLEIKKDDVTIYKKGGGFTSNEHIIGQRNILHKLNEKGYLALFVVGYDHAIQVLEYYFSDKK